MLTKQGTEFLVNSEKVGNQTGASVAALKNGGFVLTWTTNDPLQDQSGNAVKSQIYSASGAKMGDEFLVNSGFFGTQGPSTVTGLANGGFVVSWFSEGISLLSIPSSTRAQIYDAGGTAVGTEITVGSGGSTPQIASLASGGFAVSWGRSSGSFTSVTSNIYTQMYDAAGAAASTVITNATGSGISLTVYDPTITGLTGGRFVVSWEEHDLFGAGDIIRAQVYDGAGVALLASSARVTTSAGASAPAVTSLKGGGFVITWTTSDTVQDGDSDAIKAQIFDADGTRVGGEFLVNTKTVSAQTDPAVTSLADGGFIVSWQSDDATQDGDGAAIKAQQFAADGSKVGAEFRVNVKGTGNQFGSALAGLADGGFVVGWQTNDAVQDGDGTAIKAQIYDIVHAPVITSSAARSIAENRTVIGSVTATDADPLTVLAYSIVGGADAALFAINPATGGLRFLRAPDFEAPGDAGGNNVYNLVVKVSDGALFDDQSIAVTVTNVANRTFDGGTGPDVYAAPTAEEWTINGFGGDDRLTGNNGNDIVNGGTGNDRMAGRDGNDMYIVGSSGDVVVELVDDGTDTVKSAITYTLGANVENLVLTGSGATNGTGNSLNNSLTGNAGANRLSGGAGDDVLAGRLGKDVLTGGTGKDQFLFDTAPGAANADTIADFSAADDLIVLDKTLFATVGDKLFAAQFKVGATIATSVAADANDVIIYNSSSGQLYYDADGNGAGTQQLFVVLFGHPAISSADFVIG